jgi:YebC/PmpR family DNA-binding regulatory protein
MSGHSKWSTIKRKKEATDAARGKLFSKLSRAISVAVKTGGGSNPDTNHKLRVAIEAARAANMPKVNIERAISKGGGPEMFEEIMYEGFGPGGIAIILQAATDNRNRTGQEIKALFDRAGGSLAGPGAVSFNFEPKGLLVVEKEKDSESQMLRLIDVGGVEDIQETDDVIEVYVEPANLTKMRTELENKGFKIESFELVQKPKNYQTVLDEKTASRALSFLETLEGHDDIQKVYANLDIPQEVMEKINE